MPIELPIRLLEKDGRSPQADFLNLTQRNQCISGGFGSGKTWVALLKLLILLQTFPKSRACVGRFKSVDLRRTTMKTFFKICPPELYSEKLGGHRVDSLNYIKLVNGSQIDWMHFDEFDESAVKSYEINFCFLDQAEEIPENIYLLLDARIGRWDKGEVPQELITEDFPRNQFTGIPLVPEYHFLACNPDTEIHWIWQRYHPDSLEHQNKFSKTHKLITSCTLDNPSLSPTLVEQMLSRDPVWVDRYVYGKWGTAEGAIHNLQNQSILDVSEEWVNNWIRKSALYRTYDHGEASPSCMLWWAVHKGIHICYREYYQPDLLISEHRRNIAELSNYDFKNNIYRESYAGSYADPSIFNKTQQKKGGRFAISDDFLDHSLCDAPTIAFLPADNNEFATRNYINEHLRSWPSYEHPVTGQPNAPRCYFVKKTEEYPNGCYHSIIQLKSQKREKVGEINGKPLFIEKRDENVTDHAYDPIRYYFGIHARGVKEREIRPPEGSFAAYRNKAIWMKKSGMIDHLSQ